MELRAVPSAPRPLAPTSDGTASRAALLKQRFATNRSSAATSAGPGGASKVPAGPSKEHGWARVGELVD
ncbi:hypothetical protein HYH03_014006 [Edaphochlamys debaryana]|uniref:Uncharacterized protein n=1 Tax=Edaphochlamys debaryana TaxID=47281 RepID=A0A835XPQ4_9CHLO|nr:hypothetical protein HYH03_014006 [Edaphochlamys debaryana]|eukprot:KAG2487439.1 hypothetical protein HYH03_014006 [Edaphochlamys debaryana]